MDTNTIQFIQYNKMDTIQCQHENQLITLLEGRCDFGRMMPSSDDIYLKYIFFVSKFISYKSFNQTLVYQTS